MKRNALFLNSILTCTLFFTACSTDTGLSGTDITTQNNEWKDATGLSIDPNQNWFTSINVKLNIEAENGSIVTAYAINNETPIILGKKQMRGNGVMNIDVPQGIGDSFGLEYTNGKTTVYKRIYLTGDNKQVEDVKFVGNSLLSNTKTASRAIASRAAHNSELEGNSLNGISGYSSFGGWAWESVAAALPEGQNVGDNTDINHDYEFTSYGPMYISFLYGYTGNYGPRVLGYYYHSKGTYSDITYVDLTETLSYDYLDGYAKVQYQLDGDENKWYDANFDYRDGEGLPSGAVTTTSSPRKGDENYNTLLIHKAYGSRVSAMRGLTFKVDVPVGKEFGFYLTLADAQLSNEQKGYLTNAGIPESSLPKYETNFSHMEFNTISSKGQYRSAMRSYDNFTFMGMDDSNNKGDMDCNDVTFGLLDQYGQPYSNPPRDVQSWTIAFEDMGTERDFDFNDVVIQVKPNTFEHTAEVKLLAVGGTLKTELMYNNQVLCEVHNAFNVSQSSMVNTDGDNATKAPIIISSNLPWEDGATMETARNLFKIRIYRRDGSITDVNTDAYLQNNSVPQAVCIAGEWAWPKERIQVYSAYPMIGQWGKNINDKDYWNWYASPKDGQVVTPYTE